MIVYSDFKGFRALHRAETGGPDTPGKSQVVIGFLRNTDNGDKLQLKTLFLVIFDPGSSIVKSVFDCHLSGCEYSTVIYQGHKSTDGNILFYF